MRAVVVVLGDLGRSPRMQYHAHALAVNGAAVDLIGEEGVPLPAFLGIPGIQVHRLAARRVRAAGTAAFLARNGAAAIASALALLVALMRLPRPDVILVQVPPAIPTVAVAWIAARLRGARLLLDWHNLGWTLLAQRFGPSHAVVAIVRAVERALGRRADGHLVVSEALARYLRSEWTLAPVTVVRDRPAEMFAPSAAAGDPVRARLMRGAGYAGATSAALVVSPTSWTRDEDVALILDAADRLEQTWAAAGGGGPLLIVVSGEGGGRRAFDARLASRASSRVRVITTWVAPDEYPALVAAADAGICVHRSSSRLDLPMKLCDMRGAGVLPLVLDYGPVLREMVTPGEDALVFDDAVGLAAALDTLFARWPERPTAATSLHAAAARAADGLRWRAGWDIEARAAVLGS